MERLFPGYKMMIRFLKHIRDELNLYEISSYGLECVVYWFFDRNFSPCLVKGNPRLLRQLIVHLVCLLRAGSKVPHAHRRNVDMLGYIAEDTRRYYARQIQEAFPSFDYPIWW